MLSSVSVVRCCVMRTIKTRVINVSELEDYTKFAKLEQELVVRLTEVSELQDVVKVKLDKIVPVCKRLRQLQSKCGFKTSKELQVRIKKEAGY